MNGDQLFLFTLLIVLFVLLVWGRLRYDLLAFGALIIAVLSGVVSEQDAFSGFGHPAVIIIALVLIVSRGMLNAGAIEIIASYVFSAARGLSAHIAVMSVVGGALSAVINNVAALALLMSLDIQEADRAKRSPSLSLMPLSFATILGGMITLIGTPPNIVIAQYREQVLGKSFSMFDFSPVGIVCAVAGIVFVVTVGWRVIPQRLQPAKGLGGEVGGTFLAEARIPDKSKTIGKKPPDLYGLADEHDITILGVVRRGKRLPGFARNEELRKGDFLVLEGDPKSIESFIGGADLDFSGAEKHGGLTGASLVLVEAVVPETSRMTGRSALDLQLLYRHGITLLGVSRSGRRFRERVRKLKIQAGDLLLLLGPENRLEEVIDWLGALPIARRSHAVIQRGKAAIAIGLFALAISSSVAGLAYLPVALAACVAAYALFGIVGAREIYEAVEWPVIVLLGSLIPIGAALESSGGTQLIARTIVDWTSGLAPWIVLTVLMVVTMTLSDFLNNVATALIAGPIGVDIAKALGVSPDPFLMAVAVASSCAFLTPIGHKNNTIIMGPGGYHFSDYWRMGLPLELIIVAVGAPSILYFWPL